MYMNSSIAFIPSTLQLDCVAASKFKRYSVVKPHNVAVPSKTRSQKRHSKRKQKRNRTLDLGLAGSGTYVFNHPGLNLQYMRSIYIYMYTYEHLLWIRTVIMSKNRERSPLHRDVTSMAEADPGLVWRGEKGESRRANGTPIDGPHLKLGTYVFSNFEKTGQHVCTCAFDFGTLLKCPLGMRLTLLPSQVFGAAGELEPASQNLPHSTLEKSFSQHRTSVYLPL